MTLIVCCSAFEVSAQKEDFVQTDYKKADSIGNLYINFPLNDLRALAYKLTTSLSTPQEKFRAIYVWVCNNIANDYTLYKRNQHNRAKFTDPAQRKVWNKKFTKEVIDKLLRNHSTICTGYAYLIRELCQFAGIEAIIVDGYGRNIHNNIGGAGVVNHSWNVIKLNGKWYLCDATWSSGAFNSINGRFEKRYDDSYFLSDPSLFVRNHYPVVDEWLLLDQRPSLREFLDRPLVYSAVYDYGVYAFGPETFEVTATRGKPFRFQFTASQSKPISTVSISIRDNEVVPAVQHHDHRYQVEHTFTRKGVFPVHFLLDGKAAWTYTVHVK